MSQNQTKNTIGLMSRSVSQLPFVIALDQELYRKYGLDVKTRMEPLVDIWGRFEELSGWTKDQFGQATDDCAQVHGINLGKLGQPIRVVTTGSPVSPPIDVTLVLMGHEWTLQRLGQVISLIKERVGNCKLRISDDL